MLVLTIEQWAFVALAFLIGLLLGWLIWGRALGRNQRVAFELAAAQASAGDASANRLRLERDLAAARDQIKPLADEVDKLRRDVARTQRAAEAMPVAAEVPLRDHDAPPAPMAAPVRPRDDADAGRPRDLRLLKGVGDKLVDRLAAHGVPDIETLASLPPGEAARIDAELGPFAGRIARDQLIDQARLLADGRITEYEARYGRIERPVER